MKFFRLEKLNYCYTLSTLIFLLSGILVVLLGASILMGGRGQESHFYQLIGLGHGNGFRLWFLLLILGVLIRSSKARALIINLLVERLNLDIINRTEHQKQKHEIKVAIISLTAFSLVMYVVFRYTASALFAGVDGDYMISLVETQKLWGQSPFYFSSHFLQGAGGNIIFPLNTTIDPGYIIGNIGSGFNPITAHLTWSLMLFVSTLLLGRALGLPYAVSLLAAWIVPLQIMVQQPFRFYMVASLIPHIATSITATNLLITVLLQKQVYSFGGFFLRSLYLTLLSIFILYSLPSMVILVFPLLVLILSGKIILLQDSKTRTIEALMMSVLFLVIFIFGGQFIIGLFLNSASTLFKNDFIIDRGSLIFVSTLFYGSPNLPTLFGLFGLAGVWYAYRSDKRLFIIISVIGIYIAAILFFGFLSLILNDWWRLPSPVYFEFYIWSFYAFGFAFILVKIFRLLSLSIESFCVRYGIDHSFLALRSVNSFYLLSHLILAASTGILIAVTSWLNGYQRAWVFPPAHSPIATELLGNIKHSPGENFKGRVATFTGLNIIQPVNWSDLQKFDYNLIAVFGDDYRKAGLWMKSIPTLTEYNAHITPRMYYFLTTFFLREGDRQVRNMMTLRNPEPRVFRLLGITHLITDSPQPALELLVKDSRAADTIFLYSVLGANTSGISPTIAVRPKNLKEGFELIKDLSFDFNSVFFIEEDLQLPPLSPASEMEFIVNSEGYTLKAKSEGSSVIIFPVEFSSCFTVISARSDTSALKFFPSNGLFFSVLFDGALDIDVSYRNSPFLNPGCRLDDLKSFKQSAFGST
jgi:hypothetical protein